LPDLDAITILLDEFQLTESGIYVKYHRVATHSFIGLILIALFAATVARKWPASWIFRRFRPKETSDPVFDPPWERLFGISLIAVGLHFLGDWITAWGKLRFFWPFSDIDTQLGRVNSMEPVLATVTVLAWGVQNYLLGRGYRKAGWCIAGVWLLFVVLYVWLRPNFGAPAYV